MLRRMSFNIDAKRVGDPATLFAALGAIKPTSAVVMDGLGLAKEIKSRLPDAIIVHRAFGDSEAHRHRDPRETAKRWQQEGYDNIYTYGINEPVPADGKTWNDILRWLIDNMDEQRKLGLHGVIGNLPVGIIERSDIDSGLFDDYLRALDAHHGWHLAGEHEYTGFLLPWGGGWGGRVPEDLFDRDKIQPEKWIAADEITDSTDNWHLQRGRWLDARAEKLGLRKPLKLVTECFWDRMPDWEMRPTGNVFQKLQTQFGTSGFELIRGHNSLRDVYKSWFPDWSFERALYEQLRWAEQVYPAHYLGFTMFQWCPNAPDWDHRFGFDVSRLTELHQLLSAMEDEADANRSMGAAESEMRSMSMERGDLQATPVQDGNLAALIAEFESLQEAMRQLRQQANAISVQARRMGERMDTLMQRLDSLD